MTSVLELYHYINVELSDPRTRGWPLLGSPFTIISIALAYLYFVLKCGPRFMEKRQPYSCLKFIKFYNIFQIVANSMMVYYILQNGWYQNILFTCNGVTYTTDPVDTEYTRITWYFMVMKVIDYTETVVFVLRKKQQQVTFLHLYHHISLSFITWEQAKYYANGQLMTAVILNSSVHVLMYTYYLLSSMGPEMQKRINFIKPTITRIQMFQFVFIAVYALIFIVLCEAPVLPVLVLVLLVLSNLVLFYNFYQKSYKTGKKEK